MAITLQRARYDLSHPPKGVTPVAKDTPDAQSKTVRITTLANPEEKGKLTEAAKANIAERCGPQKVHSTTVEQMMSGHFTLTVVCG